MDLISLMRIKNFFKRYRIRPLKRLGQNFLVDRKVVRKIIEAANLGSRDVVLEIGPGIGNLTIELAKKAGKVAAVEKDPKMVEILKETLKDYKNIEIIQGDILKIFNYQLSPGRLLTQSAGQAIINQFSIINYKVVANLPFYLTASVIRKFLESKNPPKEMILMVQKEVAQRICPRPPKLKERRRGKPPKMNLLAVSVQFYAKPEIISYVSKESFWPQPKVDSALIKIVPYINNYTPDELFIKKEFFKIVRAGFSHPRKQLLNNFSEKLKLNKEDVRIWLLKNNIQPTQRAETLILDDWISLTKNFIIIIK